MTAATNCPKAKGRHYVLSFSTVSTPHAASSHERGKRKNRKIRGSFNSEEDDDEQPADSEEDVHVQLQLDPSRGRERYREDDVHATSFIFLMFTRVIAASKDAGSRRLVNMSPLCSPDAWYCKVQSSRSTKTS